MASLGSVRRVRREWGFRMMRRCELKGHVFRCAEEL
jgi:hypothetical protein